VQTSEQIMNEKFKSDVSEGEEGEKQRWQWEKENLQEHSCHHCRAQTPRKYLINFDVYDSIVPALRGWKRGVQKVKKQQLPLMDNWRN